MSCLHPAEGACGSFSLKFELRGDVVGAVGKAAVRCNGVVVLVFVRDRMRFYFDGDFAVFVRSDKA